MTTPQDPYQQGQGQPPYGGGYPQQPGPQGGYGQQPYPQGAYGQQPYPQGGNAPVAMQRPKSVDLAFYFVLAGIVSWVIMNLAAIPLQDQINAASGGSTQITSSGGAGAIFPLVIAAVGIGFAIPMRSGKNWARITLTVFGGLTLLVGLFGLLAAAAFFAVGGLGILAGLAVIVMDVVAVLAIVYMYRKDANFYFKQQ